jgi:hypothetical protein
MPTTMAEGLPIRKIHLWAWRQRQAHLMHIPDNADNLSPRTRRVCSAEDGIFGLRCPCTEVAAGGRCFVLSHSPRKW